MNFKTVIVILLIGIVVLVGAHFLLDHVSKIKVSGFQGGGYVQSYSFAFPTGTNQLLKSGSFRLNGVFIGNDVASSSLALCDSITTPTCSSPFATFSGNTLHGFYDLGLDIVNGLVGTNTSQTGVTIIYSNP
jgi:hypothetical protein